MKANPQVVVLYSEKRTVDAPGRRKIESTLTMSIDLATVTDVWEEPGGGLAYRVGRNAPACQGMVFSLPAHLTDPVRAALAAAGSTIQATAPELKNRED